VSPPLSSNLPPSTLPPLASGRPSPSTSSLRFVSSYPFSFLSSCLPFSQFQFYTAPTAIRLLRRLGEQHIKGHDLSSLRTIGSVGEPINPEAWDWYWEHVGNKECAVVDTYWQTETGSIIITFVPFLPSLSFSS
jgi:acetyl-CoA synthetase